MSQGFEKETTASTAKSLLGALTGLGSGFLFLFLALVALTGSAAGSKVDVASRILSQSFQKDLISAIPSTLQISKDTRTVRFRSQQPGRIDEIVYRFLEDRGELSREQNGEARKLVKVKNVRFASSNGLFKVRWSATHGETEATWALSRWGGQAKP